ncbi:MAG: hypothetical protein ABI240_03655 [Sphingomonas sp.]
MLDVLETIYGCSEQPAAAVVRIAAWQAALVAANTGSRFWSRSTAGSLLGWRGILVQAGWRSDAVWPAGRLADLAAADAAAADLQPGVADRLVD